MRARVRWELARTRMLDSDWGGSAELLAEGASIFRGAGERASEAAVESMLANALASLGRADDAWSARTRALGALSAEGDVERLAFAVGSAAETELRAGRSDGALALLNVQESLQRDIASPLACIETLVQKSLLESAAGRIADARQSAGRAERIAGEIPDAGMRARQLADIAVATAAAQVETEPRAAAAALTGAITFYRAHALPFALPKPYLLRARCAIRTGDTAAAARDLEDGIASIERYRLRDQGVDAESALYEEAIGMHLDRGDPATAFAYAERARGGNVTVPELQRRLSGSGAAVLMIVKRPRELVTFAVAEDAFEVARHAPDSGDLYDAIIAPAAPIVERARLLIIIADRQLESTSFAALRDRRSQRYLIERWPVATAQNASMLRAAPERRGTPAVAVMALPTGDARNLPDVREEVAEVSAAYGHASMMPATLSSLRGAAADILHIAGHTERQHGAGEQALVFADGQRMSWKSVPPVRAGTVVLAACETLRSPGSVHTRAPSLGGAFADAGADDVIGTLTPVGDRDALSLFRVVHRHLAAGASAAVAVREAQIEAIHEGRSPAWRALAVLTKRIPIHEEEKRSWVP
jgi:hypothetical protein